jgi:hypothetical protein
LRKLFSKYAVQLAIVLLIAGCASTPPQAPQIQRISPEELERIMPKPVPNLSLDEIVKLSNARVSADEIIQKIKDSQSQYNLSPAQILDLSQKGVDMRVLEHIQAVHEQALRDNFAEEIQKRDKEKLLEQEKLKREYQMRYPYYDPFWGYPRWGYPRPYYGPSMYYRFGF